MLGGIDEFSASARMNQYERGKHEPDLATIRRIARALNVPVAYLFAEDDELAELIRKFHSLPKKAKREITDLVMANIPDDDTV